MYITTNNVWVTLTEEEGKLIQEAIHNRIVNAGWKALFSDIKTEGATSETFELLDVYKEIAESKVIKISMYQLHLTLETMKKAYKKFPMDDIKKLICELENVA